MMNEPETREQTAVPLGIATGAPTHHLEDITPQERSEAVLQHGQGARPLWLVVGSVVLLALLVMLVIAQVAPQ
jgi:hypothetical protein